MLNHITKIAETTRLLAISRDAATVEMLRSLADSHSWQIVHTDSAWEAMDSLKTGLRPDLLLLDQPHGTDDTLQIMRCLRGVAPDLSAVVICSREDAARNSKVHELGALELLVRPFEKNALAVALQRQFEPKQMQPDFKASGLEFLASPFVDELVPGNILAEAKVLAEADVPVLITGESGTGKTAIARLIHMLSRRSRFEFLTVNCDRTPSHALDVELFGNGSTSRLERSAAGPAKVEWAEKGTLLIDEIADMPLALQEKVMHLLQDKLRISHDGERTFPADVRVLATTTHNIDKAVQRGRLREDLCHRLSAFTIQIPPVRKRREEIPGLLENLMRQLALDWGSPARPFPANVIQACQEHSWPGNIRELESFVKRYLVLGRVELSADADGNLRPAWSETHSAVHESAPDHFSDLEADSAGPTSLKSLIRNIRSEAEQKAIRTALEKTSWNRKTAAHLLGVSYRTLLYKIDQYDIRASEHCSVDLQYSGSAGLGRESRRNGKAS